MANIFKMIKENHKEALLFIGEEYFKNGFGSLSKSDIDLIFFTMIMRYCGQMNASDYDLSKLLQITQGRIRNLRVKMGLKYEPISKKKAIETLVENTQYARLEDNDKKISLPIFDPNVYIELEHLIEMHHGFVEYQLNPRAFTIRIDQLLNLLVIIKSEQTGQDCQKIEGSVLEELRAVVENEEKIKEDLAYTDIFETLKQTFVNEGVDAILDLLLGAFPGGALIKKLIKPLKKKFIAKKEKGQ